MYLEATRTDPDDWSGFARTYTSSSVQSWMCTAFPSTLSPLWEELKEAITQCYMQANHSILLRRCLHNMRQKRGLGEYVEQFQQLDAALHLANMEVSDMDKVLTFIGGLKEIEDRGFVLNEKPQILAEAYAAVNILNQSKILCSSLGTNHKRPTQHESQTKVLAKLVKALEIDNKNGAKTNCPSSKARKNQTNVSDLVAALNSAKASLAKTKKNRGHSRHHSRTSSYATSTVDSTEYSNSETSEADPFEIDSESTNSRATSP
eukprot:65330-Rhodomonas_salina.1